MPEKIYVIKALLNVYIRKKKKKLRITDEMRNRTLERRILAPTCLLSHPNVLSESSAPRVWPFT